MPSLLRCASNPCIRYHDVKLNVRSLHQHLEGTYNLISAAFQLAPFSAMPFAKDVYQKELLELGHGLPLYDPDPGTEYDKVRIFDVGYVDSRFGRFHRIFNAAPTKEHEVNHQHGTPAGFEPFQPRVPATYNGTALPAGHMHSSHVQAIGSDTGVAGYGLCSLIF